MNKYVREQYTSLPHNISHQNDPHHLTKRKFSLILTSLHQLHSQCHKYNLKLTQKSFQKCHKIAKHVNDISSTIKDKSNKTWRKAIEGVKQAKSLTKMLEDLKLANYAI